MFTQEEKLKIERKLGSMKCPICGSQNRLFTEVPTHVISFPKVNNDIDFSKVSYINALCVECLDCGYIMQFRIDTVLK